MERLYVRKKARNMEVKTQPIFTLLSTFSKYTQGKKMFVVVFFFSVNFLLWRELPGIGKTQCPL